MLFELSKYHNFYLLALCPEEMRHTFHTTISTNQSMSTIPGLGKDSELCGKSLNISLKDGIPKMYNFTILKVFSNGKI